MKNNLVWFNHVFTEELIGISLFLLLTPFSYLIVLLKAFGHVSIDFSKVSIVGFPVLISVILTFIYFKKLLHKASRWHVLFILLVLSMIFSMFFGYWSLEVRSDIFGENILIHYLKYLRDFWMFFLAGYFLPKKCQKYGLVYVVMFILIVGLTITKVDRMSYGLAFYDIVDSRMMGVYLFLGDSFAVFSLLLLANIKNKLFSSLLIVLSTIFLFLINSRTSFYIFIVSILIFSFIRKSPKKAVYFIGTMIFMFLFFYFFVQFVLPDIWDSRMLKFLMTSTDTSWETRRYLFNEGLRTIKESPIIGGFGRDVVQFGSFGYYIHNALAYWQEFGVITFLLLIFLVFAAGRHFYLLVYRDAILLNNSYNIFYLLLFIFCLIESIFARSFNCTYLWMLFGMFLKMKDELLS